MPRRRSATAGFEIVATKSSNQSQMFRMWWRYKPRISARASTLSASAWDVFASR
jgi:hypothetical protein